MDNVRSKAAKSKQEAIPITLPDLPGIYLLTCTVTDDTYVGQARSLKSRHSSHGRNIGTRYRQSRQIGRLLDLGCTCAHFTFMILEICKVEDLNARELHWIREIEPTLNNNSPRGFSREVERIREFPRLKR